VACEVYLYGSLLFCINMAKITECINRIINLSRQCTSNETDISILFDRIDSLLLDCADKQQIILNMVELFNNAFESAANHKLPNYGFMQDKVNHVRGLFKTKFKRELTIDLFSDHIGCIYMGVYYFVSIWQQPQNVSMES
jgi:hypothetical protein